MTIDDTALADAAQQALQALREAGFEHAQAGASVTELTELNIAHNEPSLMRSTEQRKLALSGIVDGRKASTELATFGAAEVAERVAALRVGAQAAPRDDANAVSADQRARVVQGPLVPDVALLADKVAELLEFRARETPRMMVDEGLAAHTRVRACTLTSGGSELACDAGWYTMGAFGTGRDGKRSSSFNEASGTTHALDGPAPGYFGLGDMLRDTERQIDARPLEGGNFTGEVVLTPPAVADLVQWLLAQLGDVALISGSSVYRERVAQRVASPLLTLRSRFDAPGVVAMSADAFVTPPVVLLRAGTLTTLTPSLYGSRKTGLPHVPLAAGGWALDAGATPRSAVIGGVRRGALVGRLSMGMPATNGDFSGVIKNSFAVSDGELGPALSEVMISGNVAQMLADVQAVSAERRDSGAWLLPWLRIGGLHFS